MPRTAREWSATDRRLMQAIEAAWKNDERNLSIRAVARHLNVSHPRVIDLMACANGTPTVDEFINLCELFSLDPAQTLREAMQATGR